MTARRCALTSLMIVASFACKKEVPPEPPREEPPVKAAEAAKPALPPQGDASGSVPSMPGPSDRECVGAIDTAVPRQVTIAGKKAELNGYKLTFLDRDPAGDEIRFGVLANINDDKPENLFLLKRYLEWFKQQKADAIIIDGDTGDNQTSIEREISMVAESGLPVFTIIGNWECKSDYNDALVAVQKRFENVIDMGRVRYVDLPHANLISLPGYHDPNFMHCNTGCVYTRNDVEDLKKVAQEASAPVILVAHGTPHGTTANAIDSISASRKNVGDPNLNGLITAGKIPFGIFGNIKEAGGKATDLAGESMIREGQWAPALYLDPGPADSVAWAMNDGTTSLGMAALLDVKGKQASYQIYRAKKLTDAEKAEAAKLAPKPEAAEADAKPEATGKPTAKP